MLVSIDRDDQIGKKTASISKLRMRVPRASRLNYKDLTHIAEHRHTLGED